MTDPSLAPKNETTPVRTIEEIDEEIRDLYFEMLSQNEVTVTFTKKDGSERVMRCTRNFNLIPESAQPKGSPDAATRDAQVIPVFDLDVGEWRCFRAETVKSIGHGG